jgi:hypothetical protein
MTAFLASFLGLVSGAIGAGGALLLAALTKVGDRLIGLKFDERIEAYKSQLNRQIEELKARLGHISDRGMRSNQLEYEALTLAWEKFIAAHVATQQSVVRWIEHADLDRMTNDELENYLSLTDYSEQNKKQLRETREKNNYVVRLETHRAIYRAEKAIFEAREILRNKSIFIPNDLEAMFSSGLDLCANGWSIQKTEFSHGRWDGSGKATIEYMEKAPKLVDGIKNAVRDRILAAYPEKAN